MEKFWGITIAVLEGIWQIVSGIVGWAASLVFKFFTDVLKSMYGKIVAITAVAILSYILLK